MKGRRAAVMGASMLMLLAGVGVIVLALGGFGGSEKAIMQPEPVGFVVPTPVPPVVVQNTAVPPTPVPEPTPVPSEAPIERIIIPSIGVDAPVVVLGLNADLSMQDPKGPVEVGWYDWRKVAAGYSGPPPLYTPDDRSYFPGWGGNAVFAGHVDYINFGAAVFYRLGQLGPDDEIQIRLNDGVLYKYHVVSLNVYSAADAPVGEITGPTAQESITLITCTGTLDRGSLEYDKRIVVRAERVAEAAAIAR